MSDAIEGFGLKAPGKPQTPLTQVMTLVAHELRLLSDSANELQDAIGDALAAAMPTHSVPLYELQNLDRLCQGISAVADFIESVGRQANPLWSVDAQSASTEVKLSELANRLAGRAEIDCDTGTFDGFDDFAAVG